MTHPVLMPLLSFYNDSQSTPGFSSAFTLLESKIFESRSGSLLLAFDYDGTLVPTVAHPDEAQLPAELKEILVRVSKKIPILILSGRCVRDLHSMGLDLPGVDLIGNHGFEWKREGKLETRAPGSWWKWREERLEALAFLTQERGGVLEDKRESVTLHFRNCTRPEDHAWWSSFEARVVLESLTSGSCVLLGGKEAWNFIPLGGSKGDALLEYVLEKKFSDVIYFGDEVTDESVFRFHKKAESLGISWIGVKVGEGESMAQYFLSAPWEVQSWIRRVLNS